MALSTLQQPLSWERGARRGAAAAAPCGGQVGARTLRLSLWDVLR